LKVENTIPTSPRAPRPFVTVASTYSRRPETITKLFDLIMSQRVVQVRGTPTTGKTILSRLLFTFIESKKSHYKPVYVTWELHGTGGRGKATWLDFLCQTSGGLASPAGFGDSHNIIFIIDEAQLSYKDPKFWMECIKSQKQATTGPYIILFSPFGSPSSIALRIDGSAPIDLSPQQRVSLLPSTDGVSNIGVCFTFEEVKDVCSAMTGDRTFRVCEDILRHLFTLTNGHPGLTHSLLQCLFEREVRKQVFGINCRPSYLGN
jgi:hypothetical protein